MTRDQVLQLHELHENKPVMIRRPGSPDWFKSRIETVLGKYLQIGHPILKGRLVPLSSGDQVEVGFNCRSVFVTFSSSILQVEHKPVAILTVLRPSADELQIEQRRKASRVDALIPVVYELLGGRGLLSVYHTLALNISSNGIVFNAKDPISPKSVIGMELHLPNVTGSITVKGQVVSCSRILKANEAMYKIRVKFGTLIPTHQERLEAFVKDRNKYAD